MHHKFVIFPFTAIVGQELIKKALLINAIDPSIGGVVIKGDKGTGKSTAVRALADLLTEYEIVNNCPFNCHPTNLRLMCKSCQHRAESGELLPAIRRKMSIVDLPLSSTEDMVVGTIDIKRALKEGIKALEPGILARANRNILYIDEVNLLDDHLVNVLLDAAAMGINIVEREGISLYHPARFILIGTMNPEEGELRPQILDRFGLCVEVKALTAKSDRLEIIKLRRAFDADPWEVEEDFKGPQQELRNTIARAQKLLPGVAIDDEMLGRIVDITTGFGIKTHRADIVMEKAACALAALHGRDRVTDDEIKEAALLALPHRMRQQPFEKPMPITEDAIEQIIETADASEQEEVEEVVGFDKQASVKKNVLTPNPTHNGPRPVHGKDVPGIEGSRGQYITSRPNINAKSVAIDATFRKAIRETGTLDILPEHLMEKVRRSKGEALYIILLDASSSMRLERRIRFAKTLSWALLKQSYEKRNRVALITFRGERAELLVPPTPDGLRVMTALEQLPTGGKTPLTHALYKAFELAAKETKARATVVLISDGKVNVFINGSLENDIGLLSKMVNGTQLVFVNSEIKHRSIGILEDMAQTFSAPHFYIEEVL